LAAEEQLAETKEINEEQVDPSEMDNEFELDKIKIKKSSDRLA
jgi:hypothetical protein